METNQQVSDMLKIAEVAEMTGLSDATVLREVHNGEFTAYRVGPSKKDIRIARASVLAYLERRLITPQPVEIETGTLTAPQAA